VIKNKTIVADIAGGTKPLKRDIGENMTISHMWSYYRWYPGLRDMLNLEVDAIFNNGINEDDTIDLTRLMEFKEDLRWCLLAGYGTLVVDARDSENPKVEALHPYIDGIGFNFSAFSKKGHPLEITMYLNTNESAGGKIQYTIPHYPCEVDADGEYIDQKPIPGEYGFFHTRTQGNIKGVQGLPAYLHLVDAFAIQWDIMKAYAPYAEKQGMAFPVVGLEDNNSTNRASVKSQFATQPTTNRMLIVSAADAVEWVSPQAGAYDPFPMLEWLNKVIARASQMNKLMLEGDPAGYLSASETSINNWESKLKEKQAYWRTQFLGPWMALGATEECNFQDPSKPTFISLMDGLKSMREAFDGLVAKQDIIDQFNVYLTNNDQEVMLHLAEEGEWDPPMMGQEGNNPKNNNGGKKQDVNT
jgi:hypothetical protein